MELKVDVEGTAMEALMHKAVLEALGAQGQSQIVQHAVAYLVKKPDSTYGSKASPLLQIVEGAANRIAMTVLSEKLQSDAEFIAQIHSLYADATKRLFEVQTRERLVEKMAAKMAEALSDTRY